MAGTIAPRTARGVFSGRRDPFGTLRDDFESLLSSVWDGEREWFGAAVPSVDLAETDKTVEVRVDLPGVKPKEIDIKLNNGILRISGERKEEKEDKGRNYHRVERRTGSFSRSLALPCPVEESEVAAEYKDGVLTITLPKAEEAKSRKIEVKC